MRDLSHPITTGMQVYPGDPGVHLEPALTLESDGAGVTRLLLSSQTGTHLDAPAHSIPGGRTTGQLRVEELVGDALVIAVHGVAPGATYGLDALAQGFGRELPSAVPSVVIVDTGWTTHFGTEAALTHPALDPRAADELMRRGMRLLAVDTLSPDLTGVETVGTSVHDVVLGGDGVIVENLCVRHALPERLRAGFFPLPIDADGAPVRAVAFDVD